MTTIREVTKPIFQETDIIANHSNEPKEVAAACQADNGDYKVAEKSYAVLRPNEEMLRWMKELVNNQHLVVKEIVSKEYVISDVLVFLYVIKQIKLLDEPLFNKVWVILKAYTNIPMTEFNFVEIESIFANYDGNGVPHLKDVLEIYSKQLTSDKSTYQISLLVGRIAINFAIISLLLKHTGDNKLSLREQLLLIREIYKHFPIWVDESQVSINDIIPPIRFKTVPLFALIYANLNHYTEYEIVNNKELILDIARLTKRQLEELMVSIEYQHTDRESFETMNLMILLCMRVISLVHKQDKVPDVNVELTYEELFEDGGNNRLFNILSEVLDIYSYLVISVTNIHHQFNHPKIFAQNEELISDQTQLNTFFTFCYLREPFSEMAKKDMNYQIAVLERIRKSQIDAFAFPNISQKAMFYLNDKKGLRQSEIFSTQYLIDNLLVTILNQSDYERIITPILSQTLEACSLEEVLLLLRIINQTLKYQVWNQYNIEDFISKEKDSCYIPTQADMLHLLSPATKCKIIIPQAVQKKSLIGYVSLLLQIQQDIGDYLANIEADKSFIIKQQVYFYANLLPLYLVWQKIDEKYSENKAKNFIQWQLKTTYAKLVNNMQILFDYVPVESNWQDIVMIHLKNIVSMYASNQCINGSLKEAAQYLQAIIEDIHIRPFGVYAEVQSGCYTIVFCKGIKSFFDEMKMSISSNQDVALPNINQQNLEGLLYLILLRQAVSLTNLQAARGHGAQAYIVYQYVKEFYQNLENHPIYSNYAHATFARLIYLASKEESYYLGQVSKKITYCINPYFIQNGRVDIVYEQTHVEVDQAIIQILQGSLPDLSSQHSYDNLVVAIKQVSESFIKINDFNIGMTKRQSYDDILYLIYFNFEEFYCFSRVLFIHAEALARYPHFLKSLNKMLQWHKSFNTLLDHTDSHTKLTYQQLSMTVKNKIEAIIIELGRTREQLFAQLVSEEKRALAKGSKTSSKGCQKKDKKSKLAETPQKLLVLSSPRQGDAKEKITGFERVIDFWINNVDSYQAVNAGLDVNPFALLDESFMKLTLPSLEMQQQLVKLSPPQLVRFKKILGERKSQQFEDYLKILKFIVDHDHSATAKLNFKKISIYFELLKDCINLPNLHLMQDMCDKYKSHVGINEEELKACQNIIFLCGVGRNLFAEIKRLTALLEKSVIMKDPVFQKQLDDWQEAYTSIFIIAYKLSLVITAHNQEANRRIAALKASGIWEQGNPEVPSVLTRFAHSLEGKGVVLEQFATEVGKEKDKIGNNAAKQGEVKTTLQFTPSNHSFAQQVKSNQKKQSINQNTVAV
ncbi:hypothetical protein [Rickettsiales endosymbiont of Stachyamoeba lipophora]|uniref:hypothetical protein n=1 Tax=Rickettsiales endosymbiont of Stachyamoeba lipophora TaxID=2486578 RepID=UPI000F65382F|nr:hypothetical protein [Rickettsiales endosymbiont of Stachyamoeba lipophora]AZL15264.1 hypothetical protein EF513_01655 [Rickettsiales endosymbiont of Stachyamoeba lipophora]